MTRVLRIIGIPLISAAFFVLSIIQLLNRLVSRISSVLFGIIGGIIFATAFFCYGFELETTGEIIRMIICGSVVMTLPALFGLAEGIILVLMQCIKGMLRG